MSFPTVLELIHTRLQQGSTPDNRKDPYKLAIAAEDGSMRWVVAAGLLSRLEAHGIFPDLIVGTSGGGIAAAYYAAGAMRFGARVMFHLNRRGFERNGKAPRFLDARRLFRGKPAMNLHGAVETVFSHKVPLPWEKLKTCPVPVYLTAVDNEGKLVLQPLHGQTPEAQKHALFNTGRIPFIAHDPTATDVLWDGGLRASIPIQEARDLGATHVLVVRCKGAKDTLLDLTKPSWIETWILHPALRRKAKGLLKILLKRPDNVRRSLELLAGNDPALLQLALPHVGIGMAEDNEGKLFRQMVEAWYHAGIALNLPEQPLPTEWLPETKWYL